MEPNPPPRLDYTHSGPSPLPARSRGATWGMFGFGVGSGLVFSLIYYAGLASGILPGTSLGLGLGAVTVKLAVGISLISTVPRWRSFGIGLLVSIPVAILIFVGVCFGMLAGMSHH